ncbi:response regulator transcription factor [Enterococcus faecium]|uniref:response regulator transcription factor n=1 Tax=Enterococcus faecium TaxID=1352 RepID=UPI0018C2A74E|nr:response regulator transcription factor [Enterococcus faecium]MBG0457769.1 response regulator transcription factor [Enterococcus faecium]MBG7841182.1 response regulator transcription factor [Enterococcus faecium]MBJ0514350.1 response regulator transcription factor [Enterococcus faecium]MBJ0679369.1 response regulator transcription factor [Enterococcus faecium]MBJ1400857.1 response regulator transcription factor [Enterococcus faecium]
MNRILVVEDDPQLQLLYRSVLERAGFSVITALNGEDALKKLEVTRIELIITDIMMPKMDGYDLLDSLRSTRFDTPVLMITAKADFEDKKRGFKLGADDYMTKPIDVNEMILRVEALLRRSKINYSSSLIIGQTKLELDAYTVLQDQHSLILPQKEFLLLYKLLSYPNKIFTRQQLMDDIWGLDTNTEERTIDVHIKRLRTRFEKTEDFQIITVRGLGYKAVI